MRINRLIDAEHFDEIKLAKINKYLLFKNAQEVDVNESIWHFYMKREVKTVFPLDIKIVQADETFTLLLKLILIASILINEFSDHDWVRIERKVMKSKADWPGIINTHPELEEKFDFRHNQLLVMHLNHVYDLWDKYHG
jgi:hypothetical protein